MTVSFCTDEHVPSVFVTTLRSNGYEVQKANTIFGEGTNDRQLFPDGVVRTLEGVLAHYPPEELAGEQLWIDQWHAQ